MRENEHYDDGKLDREIDFLNLEEAEGFREYLNKRIGGINGQMIGDRSPIGDMKGTPGYADWFAGARKKKNTIERKISEVNQWIKEFHRKQKIEMANSPNIVEKLKTTVFAACDVIETLRAELADARMENVRLKERL